jgi:hypothetical protein
MVMIALIAFLLPQGIRRWRQSLVNDGTVFSTHGEMASHQEFLKAVALDEAKDAEDRADAAPAHRREWLDTAKSWRVRAALHAKSVADHRGKAETEERLKQDH